MNAVTRPTRPTQQLRVFVYGTLRNGEYNHALLADQQYLGRFVTQPEYSLFDTGPYPAAVTGGGTAVTGEVYAINADCLSRLDRLEDYPRSYTRQLIETAFGEAWIYLWIAACEPEWLRIPGDWCKYRERA